MYLEALVRPTNRPLLACSLPSFGDRVAIYPPPAESRGGWPLFSSIRHSPPAASLGNQVGRLTFIFLSSWGLEAHTTLRNGCRCHRHCDFWCVVWFHGICGIQTSRRVSRDYICLNSGVILSILLHLPYPDRGVVWHSVLSVFTRLFTQIVACFSAFQDMCICMLSVISPSLRDGLFLTTNRGTEAP